MYRHGVINVAFLFTVVICSEDFGMSNVQFTGTTVTLECPERTDQEVQWFKKADSVKKDDLGKKDKYLTLENYEEKNDGLYYCTYDDRNYYFYIKAVVCKDCVELDSVMAFGILIADLLITLGVVLMVYFCVNKKAQTAAPQRARPPRQEGRPPKPPNPDYQELNPATRNMDVYAEAQRR